MSVFMLLGSRPFLQAQSNLRFVRHCPCVIMHIGGVQSHNDVHVQHAILMQVLSDDVYHGSVEDELATECGRNKPNILKLQRYTYMCTQT